jgi:aerobic carbon-monoxide dehydrogenase medium subunit
VANNEKLAKVCPALCALASHIGDPHVRYRGTIGGSIANNDPAADYPSAMLALGADIITDKRTIPADKYFKGLFETALKEGEVITAISFTAPAKAAYAKFPNPASRYAMAGVFVAKDKSGVRVAVTGAGDGGVFRHKGLEAALDKKFDAASLDAVAIDASNLMSDLHATAAYRAALIKVMAKRAVAAAG